MLIPGPDYPLGTTGTTGTVPRAYEGVVENLMQNKIQDYKNTFFKNQNSTISLPVNWEVCKKSTFLSLYPAKGAVGV
jgi:hypothetical protein